LQIGWDALKVQPANAAEEVVPLAGIEPALLAELDFERPDMPYPLCIRQYPFSR
jgi:hypothetical protein